MSSNHGRFEETHRLMRIARRGPDAERLDLSLSTAYPQEEDDIDEDFLLPNSERNHPRWKQQILNAPKSRFRSILDGVNGTATSKALSFQPLFPQYQAYPSKLVSRYLPGFCGEIVVVSFIFAIWALAFGLVTKAFLLDDQTQGDREVIRLSCSSRLWPSSTYCGFNGENCMPFDGNPFAFRCPASCANEQILEPHIVGDQEVNYQHYVIGGPSEIDENVTSVYRGDSFICPAAIHAGVTTDYAGGCGVLRRTGEQGNFPSVSSHGITSIGFLPRFPLSFTLERGLKTCQDPQWTLLGISVLATCLISIFTTSSAIFFSAMFCIVHFQVALASEAPYFPDFADVVSAAFGRLLPSACVGFVIYHYCTRRCLGGLTAPLEKTLLWIGPCWVGALNKYTFDQIPISRLTPHDLQQQPGAITALVIIVVVVIVIAVGQAWSFRREGRLLQYIILYLIMGMMLTALALFPGLDLRIHHYIIALLLLPGTSLQTIPSLVYQGVLVGLFINGIARWDFASVLQTPAALLQDGLLGSAMPKLILSSVTTDTVAFTIDELASGFDGISLLVNDVERFRVSDSSIPGLINWTRKYTDEPSYLRFAFTARNALGGFWYGDFTSPGTWWQNGTYSK